MCTDSAVEIIDGCGRCCRPLVAHRSVDVGYGPGCRSRMAFAARAVGARYTPEQLAKAVESVELRAVVHGARDDYFALSTAGDVIYTVDRAAATCTCPAGRHGTRCYHLAAADLLSA
jgi:hypothetical protein